MLNKVGTHDNLHHRGVVIGRQTCVMCGINDECVNHLLFSCGDTNYIWNLCDNWFRVVLVHHNCAQSHFLQFEHPCLKKVRIRVWK